MSVTRVEVMDTKIFFAVTTGIWLGCIGSSMHIAIRNGLKLWKCICNEPSSQGIGIVDKTPCSAELASSLITMFLTCFDTIMATLLVAISLHSFNPVNDIGPTCLKAICISWNLTSFVFLLLTGAGSVLTIFQRRANMLEEWKVDAHADVFQTTDKTRTPMRYLYLSRAKSAWLSIVNPISFVCTVLFVFYLLSSPFATKEPTTSWALCLVGCDIPFFITWIMLFVNAALGAIIGCIGYKVYINIFKQFYVDHDWDDQAPDPQRLLHLEADKNSQVPWIQPGDGCSTHRHGNTASGRYPRVFSSKYNWIEYTFWIAAPPWYPSYVYLMFSALSGKWYHYNGMPYFVVWTNMCMIYLWSFVVSLRYSTYALYKSMENRLVQKLVSLNIRM